MGSHPMWGQMMELVMPHRHREDVRRCVTQITKLSGESEVPEWESRGRRRGWLLCNGWGMECRGVPCAFEDEGKLWLSGC